MSSQKEFLDELEEIKRSRIDVVIEWYQKKSKLPRVLFRVVGYALILVSVSIPFLSAQGWEVLLNIAALVVAALASITSFGNWDRQWRGYKKAQFELEHLSAEWELKMMQVRELSKEKQVKELALRATETLLKKAKDVVVGETEEYFREVKMPSVKH